MLRASADNNDIRQAGESSSAPPLLVALAPLSIVSRVSSSDSINERSTNDVNKTSSRSASIRRSTSSSRASRAAASSSDNPSSLVSSSPSPRIREAMFKSREDLATASSAASKAAPEARPANLTVSITPPDNPKKPFYQNPDVHYWVRLLFSIIYLAVMVALSVLSATLFSSSWRAVLIVIPIITWFKSAYDELIRFNNLNRYIKHLVETYEIKHNPDKAIPAFFISLPLVVSVVVCLPTYILSVFEKISASLGTTGIAFATALPLIGFKVASLILERQQFKIISEITTNEGNPIRESGIHKTNTKMIQEALNVLDFTKESLIETKDTLSELLDEANDPIKERLENCINQLQENSDAISANAQVLDMLNNENQTLKQEIVALLR